MKNPIDSIRNQIHDLPACSAVPQPTVPPCVPLDSGAIYILDSWVCAETEMEGKEYELLILISAWSVVPASNGNGSVSCDMSSEKRLLFEAVQK